MSCELLTIHHSQFTMVIAVDTRGSENYQQFIFNVFKKIVLRQPKQSFIFIFDKSFHPPFVLEKNVSTFIIKPQKISLLAGLKLASFLKKNNANILVAENIVSSVNLPQCIIAPDKIKLSVKKAAIIIADSEFSKRQIIAKYKIAENKIEVVYHALEETIEPLQFEEREKFKDQFAAGNEYFFTAGKMTDEVLLDLLKAFSLFKKRQKSNMQLIIASQDNMSAAFLEKLRLYKFKEEVKINNASEENFNKMLGSAYAFIFLGDDYLSVLQAMRMNVPVLLYANGKVAEIAGNAALQLNTFEQNTIAEKIMVIFKDEKLRRELIDMGKEQIKQYSYDKSAASLWNSIEKAAN